MQYRWAESSYPAPIIVDLSFTVDIVDPCVTELTTPLTFPDISKTYGDTDTELDISIAISSLDYDFCVYDMLVDSW